MQHPSLTLAFLVGICISVVAFVGSQKIKVVDGDTVDYAFIRWRLVGIDTPELNRTKCPEEKALAQAASRRLKELVTTQDARLIFVSVNGKFGRFAGRLLIDGEDIADIAVREGWGRRYDHKKEKRRSWCSTPLPS